MRLLPVPCLLALPLACTTHFATRADETQILTDIKAFFQTGDLDERETLAKRIESDPDYDRAKVGDWLNKADLFEPLDPGTTTITVPIDTGFDRTITLRIPREYDHTRPWPLIYALHGLSGNANTVIRYAGRVLGEKIEQFVIAAPTDYHQQVIHTRGPPSAEHPLIWHAVKKKIHVDSDRVYALGYSMGGHTSWTLAILHADQLAAVIPTAGAFMLPYVEELWPPFLPNIRSLHVLNCWGAQDTAGTRAVNPSPTGGIAGVNRLMRAAAGEHDLDVVSFEDPDKGHRGVIPPKELLAQALSRGRTQYPKTVEHTYRHLYQGQAYWIEAHDWRGRHWDGANVGTLSFKPGEDPNDPETQHEAMRRAIRAMLGQIRGAIDGQTIDVRRKRFTECTIWFGDGMIDWEQPVLVKVSARKAFEGRLEPDLFVCLTQAARTYDLQRLRWAGLRYKSGRKTRPVTGRTEFPPLSQEGRKQ